MSIARLALRAGEKAVEPMEEETAPKKPSVHQIGEDLASLSLDELEDRIELLKGEIERLTQAIADKRASADVAATFFKT